MFICEWVLYRINKRNLFVHYQVRVIGAALIQKEAVEARNCPVIDAYPIDVRQHLYGLH